MAVKGMREYKTIRSDMRSVMHEASDSYLIIIVLLIINAIVIWVEFVTIDPLANSRLGTRIFLSFAGLALITTLSTPFGLFLIIPITAYNLLVNTRRLQNLIRRE